MQSIGVVAGKELTLQTDYADITTILWQSTVWVIHQSFRLEFQPNTVQNKFYWYLFFLRTSCHFTIIVFTEGGRILLLQPSSRKINQINVTFSLVFFQKPIFWVRNVSMSQIIYYITSISIFLRLEIIIHIKVVNQSRYALAGSCVSNKALLPSKTDYSSE